MLNSNTIRLQIENALADRIPSALTPAPRTIQLVAETGIPPLDQLLEGGLPLGAITEVVGPEGSGHTSFALSFIALMTQAAKVCAWIDVSDTFHPESASSIGVILEWLLWIRCGVLTTNDKSESTRNEFSLPEKYFVPPPVKKGLHGGGFGSHPRSEIKGLSDAVGNFLKSPGMSPQYADSQNKLQSEQERNEPVSSQQFRLIPPTIVRKPWSRIEQALRVADLLLQAGGFSAIVLDMGSIAPEYVSRVPLATWFRYRAAAERTQASILLLTQHPCAKSSAELVLHLQAKVTFQAEETVFAGIEYHVEISRQRFHPSGKNVIPLRKPLQRDSTASWHRRTVWAGRQ